MQQQITNAVTERTRAPVQFENPNMLEWVELKQAENYLNAGLVIEAAELFAKVMEAGGPAKARWGLARCAYIRRELHEALGYLQTLDSSEFPELTNDLGVIYYELGLTAKAHEQFDLAARESPNNPLPLRNLIELTQETGELKACTEYCRQYLALVPRDSEISALLENLKEQI